MADIAELIVALKLQDGVSSGLGRLNGQLKGMQGGLSQVGKGIGQVGAGLGTIATRGAIAAAAGLGAVVTAAVSFEDAFAGVRKTVDASEADFGKLEDRLREMARTMPVSFEELAGITEAGGALGIAFDGLDEFTKVVADLAATTDLSADQAATSLGVLGNVLNLQAEDFDNFGSALVDLGNKGASTETQILSIAERIGATGALIGLSSDQVLGFGAAVANVGIEAEAGGSALQRFFIDALTAVESGGEDLETFARTAGQTADVFRDSFRKDAGAALADFIEGLGELPEAVQIETLQDLGFNDVRITRTLLGLATDADNLTDSLSISAQAFAANSALGVEAAKRYATTASQLKILKQNVVDAAVVIGDELLPVVGELTTELVTFLNKPETRTAIKEFGENLAGGIREFVAEIKKADFGPLLDTMKGAAAIAKSAFDAFRSLPAPIQQLALAAIVANKVTGGAVGAIAGGLANILSGSLKIALSLRGSSPANPMWVQSVGGPLGGPAGAVGPAGGWAGALAQAFKGVLGGTFVAALGLAIGSAIGGPLFEASAKPARDFERGQVDDLLTSGNRAAIQRGIAILDAELAVWAEKPPMVRAAMDGLIQILEDQRGELQLALDNLVPKAPPKPTVAGGGFDPNASIRDSRPDPRKTIPAVLPDTAMAPVVGGLQQINIGLQRLLDEAKRNRDPEAGNFVPTVKLDPSQVTDLRGTPWARTGPRVPGTGSFTLPATALAPVTASVNRATAELVRNRTETSSRLLALSGNYAGTNARLDRSNTSLATIAAKNFNPTIQLTNSIRLSPTVIQQRIIQQNVISGFTGNDNSGGI